MTIYKVTHSKLKDLRCESGTNQEKDKLHTKSLKIVLILVNNGVF